MLKNPLVCPTEIMQPLAMAELAQAARHDQTVCLSLDQTDFGDRMALLVLALRVGERALPLVWWARKGAANIGCAGQKPSWRRCWLGCRLGRGCCCWRIGSTHRRRCSRGCMRTNGATGCA
ncbi:hypothetical protein [Thiorhodospira sibirica]|uniref:hypothetical protein n=1 Tax=Thiorhodospira sibirica TaxID=154347 RepID=UPI001FECAB64|nr:hypothetical protein [Thiorhodospira sibirica]